MKIIITTFFLLSLTACSIIPGIQSPFSLENTSEGNAESSKDFKLIEINNDFIKAQIKKSITPDLYQYRIGVNDIINVVVWGHSELTIPAGSFRSASSSGRIVQADGTIFFPHIGNVKAAGLTTKELRELITKKLSVYLENPQVDVNVASHRAKKVYLVGEVIKPGTYQIDDIALTLLDVISKAGGLNQQTADASGIFIIRNKEDKQKKPKVYQLNLRSIYATLLAQKFVLKSQDVVYVTATDVSQWNTLINGLLPSATLHDRLK
ncbi:Polysaccharide export lipoprotein Wza [uncultured Candidatus Thioglobus sp.]|nr:Polysaccharide export lipoprotein Wza [uncultured Candidatus Thioglobus sp.]SMN00659.1 Polysaccharide export lipoprotein Wza [uncultured Candidatus Thioglobus sp.]